MGFNRVYNACWEELMSLLFGLKIVVQDVLSSEPSITVKGTAAFDVVFLAGESDDKLPAMRSILEFVREVFLFGLNCAALLTTPTIAAPDSRSVSVAVVTPSVFALTVAVDSKSSLRGVMRHAMRKHTIDSPREEEA